MKQWLLVFFSNLLSSVIISAFVFLAALSVMTGEFPPKISHIKQAYESVSKMSAMAADWNKENSTGNDDNMIDKLTNFKKKQQALGEQIFSKMKTQVKDEVEASLEVRLLESERRISMLQNRLESLALELEIMKRTRGQ
jgi:predicted PurR-regulated permease PerM